jgi:hypothetical protein
MNPSLVALSELTLPANFRIIQINRQKGKSAKGLTENFRAF